MHSKTSSSTTSSSTRTTNLTVVDKKTTQHPSGEAIQPNGGQPTTGIHGAPAYSNILEPSPPAPEAQVVNLAPALKSDFASLNSAAIAEVAEAGKKEKVLWSERYAQDEDFKNHIDAYVMQWAKLDEDISKRRIQPSEIPARANAIAMTSLTAFGFHDAKGWTKETQKDCMEAGELFATGSIVSNWITQLPAVARNVALMGAHAYFAALTPATSVGLAGTLIFIGLAYTGIQVAGLFVGPLFNGSVQSEFGKKQTHLEPLFWPNVSPSSIVGREGAKLPDRDVLEKRIAKLTSINDGAEITKVYKKTVGRLEKSIEFEKKKIEKYETFPHKLNYPAKLRLSQTVLKKLEAKKAAYESDKSTPAIQKAHILYDLEVELEFVKMYHSLNAADNQFKGRAMRQAINALNPILSLVKLAGYWPEGFDALFYAISSAISVTQPIAYNAVHGTFGGQDAMGRLAKVAQIAAVTKVGNLGMPGEVDGKALDNFGKGPILLRLEGQKKILQFDSRVHILRALAFLADDAGTLPGGWDVAAFDDELNQCKTPEARYDLLYRVSRSPYDNATAHGDWANALASLQLYEQALEDIVLAEDAANTGDSTTLFSSTCHMTDQAKALLLRSLQFGVCRLWPYLGRGPRLENQALKVADQAFATRVGRVERYDWVGSMHQCMQKLGESWLGFIYGGAGPNALQAVISLGGVAINSAYVHGGVDPDTLELAGKILGGLGNGISLVGSIFGGFSGKAGQAPASVKNKIRMQQQDLIGKLPNMGVMMTFPFINVGTDHMKMENFKPLGGAKVPERKDIKLGVFTPQTGLDNFWEHEGSLGGPGRPWKIVQTALNAKGGQTDKVAARYLPTLLTIAKIVAPLSKINREKLARTALVEKFAIALHNADERIDALAKSDKDTAAMVKLERDKAVAEFWSRHVVAYQRGQREVAPPDVYQLVREAYLAALDENNHDQLSMLVLPMLKQMARQLREDSKLEKAALDQMDQNINELDTHINGPADELEDPLVDEADDQLVNEVGDQDKKKSLQSDKVAIPSEIAQQKYFAVLALVGHVGGARQKLDQNLAALQKKIFKLPQQTADDQQQYKDIAAQFTELQKLVATVPEEDSTSTTNSAESLSGESSDLGATTTNAAAPVFQAKAWRSREVAISDAVGTPAYVLLGGLIQDVTNEFTLGESIKRRNIKEDSVNDIHSAATKLMASVNEIFGEDAAAMQSCIQKLIDAIDKWNSGDLGGTNPVVDAAKFSKAWVRNENAILNLVPPKSYSYLGALILDLAKGDSFEVSIKKRKVETQHLSDLRVAARDLFNAARDVFNKNDLLLMRHGLGSVIDAINEWEHSQFTV